MIKKKIKKAWNWLWYSDSLLSWIVSLIIAFILVKFVFFPFLSLVLGTSLPLVVVESESMKHPQAGFVGNVIGLEDSFELWWQSQGDWYEDRNIEKSQASEWPLKTGFDKGDIMLVWGRGNLEIGDVIIFNANAKHPIIHRIVDIDKNKGVIETKGDNNIAQLHDEKSITENAVIGEAVFRVPKLGWIKLVFVEIINAFTK